MNRFASDARAHVTMALTLGPASFAGMRMSTIRRDPWVVLVVVAVAVILAVGLVAAWWMACQSRGMYPAFDMPNWQNGGTWKIYCRA